MQNGFDHFPAQRQREIEHLIQVVFEEFDDMLALARHDWKKKGRI